MNTFRTFPHLQTRLRNMGMSAAGAACLVREYRMAHACGETFHVRMLCIDEVLRAAYQNRHTLKVSLPGSAKYR